MEIRKVLSSTDTIESLTARCRRAVTTKGHFPTEQAVGTGSPQDALPGHPVPGPQLRNDLDRFTFLLQGNDG